MTTAHRATWKAARGGLQEEGSFRLHVPSVAISSKDAPTERNLKLRAPTPTSRADLKARLEEPSNPVFKRPRRSRFSSRIAAKLGAPGGDEGRLILPATTEQTDEGRDDAPHTGVDGSILAVEVNNDASQAKRVDNISPREDSESERSDASDDVSDDDDSDDDEAELVAELESIRKEREFERIKKQSEEQEREEREESERIATGNPLLGHLSSFNDEISDTASIATGSMPAFAVRRRWDDDLVFRNQSRGERKAAPRFVNDTTRNDFHQRFMKQYMR